jgi:hypothetical protein
MRLLAEITEKAKFPTAAMCSNKASTPGLLRFRAIVRYWAQSPDPLTAAETPIREEKKSNFLLSMISLKEKEL